MAWTVSVRSPWLVRFSVKVCWRSFQFSFTLVIEAVTEGGPAGGVFLPVVCGVRLTLVAAGLPSCKGVG